MAITIKFKIDGEKGKAKGVYMEEEEDIPQIVGLSKKQFFGFLLAALLMGGGIFGAGYTLAYFKSEKTHKTDAKNSNSTKKRQGKYGNLGLNQDAIDESLESNIPGSQFVSYTSTSEATAKEATEVYGKNFYVILGIFKNETVAKNLVEKLKDLGKKGNIKSHELSYVVYIGPYESQSLAQNEIDSIALATSLNGSITRILP